MLFESHSRSKTSKSSVALLLQPMLHNFSAVAAVNHLNGRAYRQMRRKTRKSNAALLLPHVFAVSPLLRYSYKKMGVGGVGVGPTFRWATLVNSSAFALSPLFPALTGSARVSSLESALIQKGWGRGNTVLAGLGLRRAEGCRLRNSLLHSTPFVREYFRMGEPFDRAQS